MNQQIHPHPDLPSREKELLVMRHPEALHSEALRISSTQSVIAQGIVQFIPPLRGVRGMCLAFVIRIGAFRREDLTNPIRHCEERSDVAISTGSFLLFFSHCKSIYGHDKSSLYKSFKNSVILRLRIQKP